MNRKIAKELLKVAEEILSASSFDRKNELWIQVISLTSNKFGYILVNTRDKMIFKSDSFFSTRQQAINDAHKKASEMGKFIGKLFVKNYSFTPEEFKKLSWSASL